MMDAKDILRDIRIAIADSYENYAVSDTVERQDKSGRVFMAVSIKGTNDTFLVEVVKV